MKVGIIGAGASGMMAAVIAASKNAEVVIFEKKERIGQKLLVTGNGKCNLGNLDFDLDRYYCEDKDKLEEFFSCFSHWDTVAFFESNGLMTKNKNNWLYPYSEQASTVLDIFRKKLKALKVKTVTGVTITDITYQKRKKVYTVETPDGSYEFNRLILSCGGPASQKKGEGLSGFTLAEKFGHSVTELMPGLVQLCSNDSFIKGMAGVRAQAMAELYIEGRKILKEQGEVQFTNYGISGIPVFQLSREAAYALSEGKEVSVKINFFPDYEDRVFAYTVRNRYELMENATLEDFLLGMLNKKINTAMMKYLGLKASESVKELGFKRIREIMQSYRSLEIHITATNGMENAQVCAGGIPVDEVDDRLQSVKQPGLYLTGELLNIDGVCGGYNLQWAWTSGYIAGMSAAGCKVENFREQNKEKGFLNA